MTLDDVVAVANALRTEVALGLSQVIGAIQSGAADVVSVGNALRTEVALGISRLAGPAPTADTTSAFDRPQPVIVVGPRPLPVSGMPGAAGGPKAAGPDPGAFDKTAALLQKLAKGAGEVQSSLTNFLGVFDKALAALGGGMSKFVSLANPAAVYKFNLALENAGSSIGRILTPALERVTELIQKIGNAIESLSPEAKQAAAAMAMGGGLAGVVSALASAAVIAVRALGPIPLIAGAVAGALGLVLTSSESGRKALDALSKALQAVGTVAEVLARTLVPVVEMSVVPVLEELSRGLLDAANAMTKVVDAARGLVGLSPIGYDPNKRTATAVRTGGIGDLRGMANRAYTSAYNTGSSTIAQDHLKVSRDQLSVLQEIRNSLNPMSGFGKGLGNVNGREISASNFLETAGRRSVVGGGETGAAVGRSVGWLADAAASPFLAVPRTLTRMAAHLE